MAVLAGPKSSIYVYYGAEGYLLDRALRTVRKWPGRVVRAVDLEDGGTDQAIVDQLRMGGEDASPRTVIVDEAQEFKEGKAKVLRQYVDDLLPSDTQTVLVAFVRESKLPAVWAHVASKGKSVEYQKLKTFGKTNEVIKFIREHAVEMGLSLDVGVDEDLFKLTAGDLYRIHNELRKVQILASVKNTAKVTRQMLMFVVAPAAKVEPWEVADAAFAKNKTLAMSGLSVLFRTSGDDGIVPLVYALMKQIQKFLVARHMVDSGTTPDLIAQAIDMHPYRCKEFFLPMVRKHDPKILAQHMGLLCKLDRDVKGSSRSKRTLVELAVLSIAE